jgi:hypothetical protein
MQSLQIHCSEIPISLAFLINSCGTGVFIHQQLPSTRHWLGCPQSGQITGLDGALFMSAVYHEPCE